MLSIKDEMVHWMVTCYLVVVWNILWVHTPLVFEKPSFVWYGEILIEVIVFYFIYLKCRDMKNKEAREGKECYQILTD